MDRPDRWHWIGLHNIPSKIVKAKWQSSLYVLVQPVCGVIKMFEKPFYKNTQRIASIGGWDMWKKCSAKHKACLQRHTCIESWVDSECWLTSTQKLPKQIKAVACKEIFGKVLRTPFLT